MTRTLHVAGRVLTVSALTVGMLPFGSTVRAATVRTDTKLAGFSVLVEATPLRVLLDDPRLEVPHDTGTAVAEADPNYTLASVSAGPNAHAITSTLWPGNLLGQGLAQVANGAPAYPIKGEARYPDKPYDKAGVDGGQVSSAHAEGLEAKASADGLPTNKPGGVTVGGVTSTSLATVTEKDVAVGNAVSAVQDVQLLAGVVSIGSVKTVLTASADGTTATSTGTTTVSGLTIANNTFGVDDKGLRAGPQSSALPSLDSPEEVRTRLGISMRTVNQTVVKTPGGVKRVGGGLIVDIDTGPLRALLSPATDVVNPIVRQLIAGLPPAVGPVDTSPVTSQLYYLLKATPHITFIFGSANVQSAATLPITLPPFTFPSFPPVGGSVLPPSGSGSGFTSGTPPVGSVTPVGVVGSSPFVGGSTNPVTPPVVGPAPTGNVASESPDAGFGGISPGWLFGAALGAGLLGWGLTRFLGLAGGAPLGLGCRLGAPTTVPNLRSVTA